MTLLTVHRCDRCGSDIPQRSGTRLTRHQRDHGAREQDLCDNCTEALREFMANEAADRIPKGYKRVARPCPHHVPCAEPWGCSGEELVRESDPRPSLDEQGSR